MNAYILMFLCTCTLDVIWARYTIAIADRRAEMAGALSALIFLVGGGITVSYNHNPLLLLPAAFGAFIGTIIAVKTAK